MSKALIYKPYETIERKLRSTSVPISKIEIKNDVPDLLESMIYMRDFMTLYQLHITPKQSNLVIQDLLTAVSDGDMEEVVSSFMESDRSRYISSNSTIFIQNYSLQVAYASDSFMNDQSTRTSFANVQENRFFTYNSKLISNEFFKFIIEFTRHQSNYDSMIIKLPTIVSKAMTEYMYLLSTLFQDLRVIKHKSSLWLRDTFIVMASRPYKENIVAMKNLIGLEVSTPISLKKRQTTFRLDKLDGKPFTSILVDTIPTEFLREWNEFRTEVSNEIYRYLKTVKLSIDSNNLINEYQLFLKSMTTTIKAGVTRPQVTFADYMKLLHEDMAEPIPVTRYYSDLTTESKVPWSKALTEFKELPTFKARGQVKLLLTELMFLTRLLPRLQSSKPKVILYIGAAPGVHIEKLISKFHNPTITWILYDKVQFSHKLRKPEVQEKYNIILVNNYFTSEDIKKFKSPSSIYRGHEKYVISDIRLSTGEEPSTEDLIRDYNLENELVMELSPEVVHLKWRYPYLDEGETVEFERVHGSKTEVWIQAFAKPSSSEMRLYMEGPEYRLVKYNTEDCHVADRRLVQYKVYERYIPREISREDMILTECRCNDCTLLNLTVSEAMKSGITITIEDIMDACGSSS